MLLVAVGAVTIVIAVVTAVALLYVASHFTDGAEGDDYGLAILDTEDQQSDVVTDVNATNVSYA